MRYPSAGAILFGGLGDWGTGVRAAQGWRFPVSPVPTALPCRPREPRGTLGAGPYSADADLFDRTPCRWAGHLHGAHDGLPCPGGRLPPNRMRSYSGQHRTIST